jgi:hypothetical protein
MGQAEDPSRDHLRPLTTRRSSGKYRARRRKRTRIEHKRRVGERAGHGRFSVIAARHGPGPCHLVKVGVAGSNSVVRSREPSGQGWCEPALRHPRVIGRAEGSRTGPVSYAASSRGGARRTREDWPVPSIEMRFRHRTERPRLPDAVYDEIADALVAEAERLASSEPPPSSDTSLKAPKQMRRRSKEEDP